ncbi:hypothetical protein K438DRAFT_1771828 [Mycena galopus ATCC 62051]|nr:hypothetical protein K438DRAFT_1771828 [Mycena galopus ATCC 62051]
MGLIYAARGEHEVAVDRFIQATVRDPYLAVIYFRCGVSNFLLARYDLAYRDFREALRHLRDNQTMSQNIFFTKLRKSSVSDDISKGRVMGDGPTTFFSFLGMIWYRIGIDSHSRCQESKIYVIDGD